MALRLRYIGARPYTEFMVNGVVVGFSRGMERDDIDDDWIREQIIPAIANGVKMWEVDDLSSQAQAQAMAQVLVEPEPEPEPEPAVSEIVEEVEETDTTSGDVLLDGGFEQSMTRAQMMSWCSERGISVQNTDTKASLTEKAREFITGASE
jgi:hypothetical protein